MIIIFGEKFLVTLEFNDVVLLWCIPMLLLTMSRIVCAGLSSIENIKLDLV